MEELLNPINTQKYILVFRETPRVWDSTLRLYKLEKCRGNEREYMHVVTIHLARILYKGTKAVSQQH
jgi:hypothetical protein